MKTQQGEAMRETADADTLAVHEDDATHTLDLFDNGELTVKATVAFDTATLVNARFHRVLILTNGQLVAEFLPQNLELPRLMLDDAELHAAAIFAPALNEELATAIEAMDRTRRKLGRP